MSEPRLHALIIDDEKNIRVTLRLCLEGLGCDVVEASDLASARAALARQGFDLVFLDLRLGDADGLELLPALASVPEREIVIVTAFGSEAALAKARQGGAQDYLPKPFTPAQIRAVVERIAAKAGKRSAS